MKERIYLKGLNGLRAIAAIAVVFSHTNMGLQKFNLPAKHTIDLAGYGVTIFFALSGFLITYLLLKEEAATKNIDIKKFYIRRVLRIWPLYYLYLFISLFVIYFIDKNTTAPYGSIPYYVFLMANIPFILSKALPYLFHYWSLGVEEQFYLFWPWLTKKSKNKFNVILIFTIVFLLFRILAWYIERKTGNGLFYLILNVTRFDCMSIGALGAVLYNNNNRYLLEISKSIITQILFWIIILLMIFNKFHIISLIDSEILAVMTVFMIVNQASNPKPIIDLENKLADFIGKISFGIYVYHPIIISLSAFIISRFIKNNSILTLSFVYITVLTLTIAVSYLSYNYFEKPFLNFKNKFSLLNTQHSLEK